MSADFDRQPGATNLVDGQRGGARLDGASAGTPGKQTLTEQLRPAPPRSAAGAGTRTTYTVQAGETLQVIAAKLNTTVAALKAANLARLKDYATASGGIVQGFHAGEVIEVPGPSPRPEPGATTAAAPPPATAAAGPTAAAGARGAGGATGASDAANPLEVMGHALADFWSFVTGAHGAPAEHGASSAPAEHGGAGPAAGTAPLADLSDAQRGEKLSTFHPDELKKDNAGKPDPSSLPAAGRAGAIARGQWLTSDAIRGSRDQKGAAFVASVDALLAKNKFTEDQGKVIAAAKEFAAAPKELSPEQEKNAAIHWGGAKLTLDGTSLNEDLKARLVKYIRFLAWAGLVTGPTPVSDVMRSPRAAHLISVAWMFNLSTNSDAGGWTSSLHKKDNRQKLIQNVTAAGGTDKDGNTWLSDATVEGLKAKKDDDAALFEYIKTTAAPEAQKVKTQFARAAEGYKDDDKRHPNVFPGHSVSNHLLGEAVDLVPPFVFNNKFDPLIDAIAMHFGLYRAVKDDASSPEHWHYERLGMPPGTETPGAAAP